MSAERENWDVYTQLYALYTISRGEAIHRNYCSMTRAIPSRFSPRPSAAGVRAYFMYTTLSSIIYYTYAVLHDTYNINKYPPMRLKQTRVWVTTNSLFNGTFRFLTSATSNDLRIGLFDRQASSDPGLIRLKCFTKPCGEYYRVRRVREMLRHSPTKGRPHTSLDLERSKIEKGALKRRRNVIRSFRGFVQKRRSKRNSYTETSKVWQEFSNVLEPTACRTFRRRRKIYKGVTQLRSESFFSCAAFLQILKRSTSRPKRVQVARTPSNCPTSDPKRSRLFFYLFNNVFCGAHNILTILENNRDAPKPQRYPTAYLPPLLLIFFKSFRSIPDNYCAFNGPR